MNIATLYYGTTFHSNQIREKWVIIELVITKYENYHIAVKMKYVTLSS